MMNDRTMTLPHSTPNDNAESQVSELLVARRKSIAGKLHIQDLVFHRLTQSFSLLVLFALAGIIVSLFLQCITDIHKVRLAFFVVR